MRADFVKYDLGHVAGGSIVEITLGNRANVWLMDGPAFSRYRRGEQVRAFGGSAVRSPVRLEVPTTGHWYVTIDLGGAGGTIRSSVRVLAGV